MSCQSCSTVPKTAGVSPTQFNSENLYTWCTMCGNYGIHSAIKRALSAEEIAPKDVLLCFDIGCNGNGSDKIEGYRVHGLHGRVLPLAAGASISNRGVQVIAMAGDGATLSEGINHLIHAVRCNYPMVFLIHNNANYGLTTGQASSTTPQDVSMTASPDGLIGQTLSISDLVLSSGASFFARGFSGNIHQLESLIRQGIQHDGLAVIEILQSCPTYNKAMTHEWYLERLFDVADQPDYDLTNLSIAREIAHDSVEKIATGLLYKSSSVPCFLTGFHIEMIMLRI